MKLQIVQYPNQRSSQPLNDNLVLPSKLPFSLADTPDPNHVHSFIRLFTTLLNLQNSYREAVDVLLLKRSLCLYACSWAISSWRSEDSRGLLVSVLS